MLLNPTLEKLQTLKLTGMLETGLPFRLISYWKRLNWQDPNISPKLHSDALLRSDEGGGRMLPD